MEINHETEDTNAFEIFRNYATEKNSLENVLNSGKDEKNFKFYLIEKKFCGMTICYFLKNKIKLWKVEKI